jgi:hypothetical protein
VVDAEPDLTRKETKSASSAVVERVTVVPDPTFAVVDAKDA